MQGLAYQLEQLLMHMFPHRDAQLLDRVQEKLHAYSFLLAATAFAKERARGRCNDLFTHFLERHEDNVDTKLDLTTILACPLFWEVVQDAVPQGRAREVIRQGQESPSFDLGSVLFDEAGCILHQCAAN